MGNPGDPERDQQGQRRLRPVRGGGQGIESKNRDSRSDADVFGALFTGGQGTAK
jgi:hypothetical protein